MKKEENHQEEKEQVLEQNLNNQPTCPLLETRLAKSLLLGIGIAVASIYFSEVVMAAGKYDIDAGIDGAFTPYINGAKAHWGKALFLLGVGYTLFAPLGDMKQRAIQAGIGVIAAGGTITGLSAMLT